MIQPVARAAIEVDPEPRGLHVAIIMDGNGRWAAQRGWPRPAGHAAGVEAVRRTIEGAADLGLGVLTLYAFSSDNWSRSETEVRSLMRLLYRYLAREGRRCAENGIRLAVIGRRDRLEPRLVRAIAEAEAATEGGERFLLRLAVDYSARDAILRAASRLSSTADSASREEFARLLAESPNDSPAVPDVDLLIRTGGEKRLSDFLLWESAYAELLFSDVMWPDFDAGHLALALAEFERRERRFGSTPSRGGPRAAPAWPEQVGRSRR
jgi:undecaprenyl diphosphate synthase